MANAPQPPFDDLRTSKRSVVNRISGLERVGVDCVLAELAGDEGEIDRGELKEWEEKEEAKEDFSKVTCDKPEPAGETGGGEVVTEGSGS